MRVFHLVLCFDLFSSWFSIFYWFGPNKAVRRKILTAKITSRLKNIKIPLKGTNLGTITKDCSLFVCPWQKPFLNAYHSLHSKKPVSSRLLSQFKTINQNLLRVTRFLAGGTWNARLDICQTCNRTLDGMMQGISWLFIAECEILVYGIVIWSVIGLNC